MESQQTEYKFVDLYSNNKALGLHFMISGDKFIQIYTCGDLTIRDGDDFVCKLCDFHNNDNVRTLIFINDDDTQMIHVNNIDGKIYTSGLVKGYFMLIEMSDKFETFQQY